MEVEVNTPALPMRESPKFYDYIYKTVMSLWRGKTNNIGTFSIPAGATETTVADSRVTEISVIPIVSLDSGSNAGVLYISERNGKEGYFKVCGPASSVEQHFTYAVIG